MLKNVILIGIFAVLFGVQLATVQSLDCFYCVAEDSSCTNIQRVTCNQEIADQTTAMLSEYKKIPIKTDSSYECIRFTDSPMNAPHVIRTEIRSCAYKNIDICSVNYPPIKGSRLACHSCRSNYCNPAPSLLPNFSTIPIVGLCFLAVKIVWN